MFEKFKKNGFKISFQFSKTYKKKKLVMIKFWKNNYCSRFIQGWRPPPPLYKSCQSWLKQLDKSL